MIDIRLFHWYFVATQFIGSLVRIYNMPKGEPIIFYPSIDFNLNALLFFPFARIFILQFEFTRALLSKLPPVYLPFSALAPAKPTIISPSTVPVTTSRNTDIYVYGFVAIASAYFMIEAIVDQEATDGDYWAIFSKLLFIASGVAVILYSTMLGAGLQQKKLDEQLLEDLAQRIASKLKKAAPVVQSETLPPQATMAQ